MKTLMLALLLLGVPLAHAANPGDETCRKWTLEMLDSRSDACDDLCPQAMEFDDYDYREGLSEAFRSRAGLSRFFAYTGRSSIMGAGGDAQACTLHALLMHWGDARYAVVLSKHSPDVRGRVISLLDYAGIHRFEPRYPKTHALAVHED